MKYPLAFALLAAPAACAAQTGLLIVAHGSDSAWNSRVLATSNAVRWEGPIRVAFVMGPGAATSSVGGQARSLVAAGAKRIVVVPLMVSTWGAHVRDIDAEVAGEGHAVKSTAMPSMASDSGFPVVPATVTGGMDAAPELGAALLEQWQRLSPADRARPLMLVAHGPDTDIEAARWVANITAACRQLAEHLPDHAVHVGLLRDDAPPAMRAAAVAQIRDTITALARQRHDSTLVMTVLISSGDINNVVVPHDLSGMPMHYIGSSLTPSAPVAEWIRRIALEAKW
ncbi:MAG TPA: CbiX/SirB N-terminal domain-containing protein [Gemmatimonadales bacterium]|jgi:sirohydrochlorin ferrochelatase